MQHQKRSSSRSIYGQRAILFSFCFLAHKRESEGSNTDTHHRTREQVYVCGDTVTLYSKLFSIRIAMLLGCAINGDMDDTTVLGWYKRDVVMDVALAKIMALLTTVLCRFLNNL
jgi:hypothetical protein